MFGKEQIQTEMRSSGGKQKQNHKARQREDWTQR